jgi:hypothetical protein
LKDAVVIIQNPRDAGLKYRLADKLMEVTDFFLLNNNLSLYLQTDQILSKKCALLGSFVEASPSFLV